jgi:glycosyltransferase involved in cell wall biosynthesis/Tfp pilus assembly protein PilF
MKQPTLSVCMIVKDEEKNLPRALSSIKGLADEIIVVDTGSKDKTVDIAKSFGAKVYYFDWCDDFSAARNESLRHATKDYILWLDADDEFETEKRKDLKLALSRHRGCAFCLVVRLLTGVSVEEFLQPRVFPNFRGIRFEGRIHEQIAPSLLRLKIPMKSLEISITHHGYKEHESVKFKLERNKTLLEAELRRDPKDLTTKTFYARTLLGLRDVDGTERVLKEIVHEMDKDKSFCKTNFAPLVYFDLLNIEASSKKIDEMQSYLIQYIEKFGNDFISEFAFGTIYLFKEDYEKAEEYLSRAEKRGFGLCAVPFSLSTVYGKLYAKKAFCLAKLGRVEQSRKYVNLAFKTETEDLEVNDLLADTSIVLKDPHLLSLSLEKFENEGGRHSYLKGMCHLMKKEFADAAKNLKDAIDSGYKEKNCYLSLMIANKGMGAIDEAKKALQEFLEKEGGDDDMLKELALLHLETQEIEAATHIWKNVIEKSEFETIAFQAHCSIIEGDWKTMLLCFAELHKKLFDSEPLSAEKIFELPHALIERGEKRASEIVSKSLKSFKELSPF